jgi:hypothetical protein
MSFDLKVWRQWYWGVPNCFKTIIVPNVEQMVINISYVKMPKMLQLGTSHSFSIMDYGKYIF